MAFTDIDPSLLPFLKYRIGALVAFPRIFLLISNVSHLFGIFLAFFNFVFQVARSFTGW